MTILDPSDVERSLDGSAMDDLFSSSHPLNAWRINMGDASLAADGMCLAARAFRNDEERLTVLRLASEIVRDRPGEAVLNAVATAISVLSSTDRGPVTLTIPRWLVLPPHRARRRCHALGARFRPRRHPIRKCKHG